MTDHIDALAAEIVTLINASPRTPRVDEIAAILARAAAPAASAEDPLAQQWDRALAELHAGIGPAQDDEVYELQKRLAEATLAIWRRGARSVADLPLFARLAREWACIDFKANLVPSPEGLDEQCVAQLVNAVLSVTGANVQEERQSGNGCGLGLLETAILLGLKDDLADAEPELAARPAPGLTAYRVLTDMVAQADTAWTAPPSVNRGPRTGGFVFVDPNKRELSALKTGDLVAAVVRDPREPDRAYRVLRQFVEPGLLTTNRPRWSGSDTVFRFDEDWIEVEILGVVAFWGMDHPAIRGARIA